MFRILVADDETFISGLIHDCLTAEGYDVVTAANGQVAHRLFQQSSFDLVISDIVMPEMDGLELIKLIKQKRPETRIIAMSAGGDLLAADVYLDPAKTFGADQRINKPFEIDEMVGLVKRMLGQPT